MDLSYVVMSMALLLIGIWGIVIKRNPLILFLSIEMMFNATNLLFVAFAQRWGDPIGQLWVFFVLIVAAAEAAVGLAIIISLYRARPMIDVDRHHRLRG